MEREWDFCLVSNGRIEYCQVDEIKENYFFISFWKNHKICQNYGVPKKHVLLINNKYYTCINGYGVLLYGVR